MDAEQHMPGGFALPSWRRTPPPPDGWSTRRACWWLLLPEAPASSPGSSSLAARLTRRLLEAGQQVVLVTPGPHLAALAEPPPDAPGGLVHWSLPPAEPAAWGELLGRLTARGLAPAHLVHLWSLLPPGPPGAPEDVSQEASGDAPGDAPGETSGGEAFERALGPGFHTLLFLLQALEARQPRPQSLTVLTHRMRGLGEESPCPERTPVLGPLRAAAGELSPLACRSVDVSLPAPGSWQEARLVGWLLAECAGDARELDVVYRGAWRHVRAFEPVHLPPAAPGARWPRERGVYLVLGGTGTLGAHHAEALARQARGVRLVLVGRSLMPERIHWDRWVETHEAEEPLSRRIRQVRALEALGAEVRLVSADVADREQLRGAVEATLAHFGALHGVLFCVGAVNASLARRLPELTPEEARVLFQGRVHGLYALEELLRGRPLDFCLLASSLAATGGRGASAAYAAAMHFMDAFAARQSQRTPVPWVSVAWEAWTDAPDASADVPPVGARPLVPAEGVELLGELLALGPALSGLSRVTVSPRHPAPPLAPGRPARPTEGDPAPPAEPDAPPPRPGPPATRPALGTTYVAPRDAVEESIAKLWESMLGITGVGIYDNFFELGGDWRTGVSVMGQVREQLGVPLPPVSLQEGPTVELLARRLKAASEGLPDTSFDEPAGPLARKPPGDDDDDD